MCASPRHSLLVPIGKRFVIVACSTGYLTPVMLTPVHRSESDSTDSEQPARAGMRTLPPEKIYASQPRLNSCTGTPRSAA